MSAPLLRSRRFLPLFLVQFLGAFNDQAFQKAFVALLTYRLGDATGLALETLGVIASALFILPFALVTPTAGQIADRMDKARMMRRVKAWEIAVMALAAVGFHLESVGILYAALFLMGAQSAMFAPVKYAILPQHVAPAELMAANGLVQGGTFLAILLGAIIGNELALRPHGPLIVSALVLAVAVLGWLASLSAPPAPPLGPPAPVDWLVPRAVWRLVAECRAAPGAWSAIRAAAWFWFVGATFLSLLPAYARHSLGADETVVTVLLAAFSIGVAAGAAACPVLVRALPEGRLPVVGAAGIAVMAGELWLATQAAAPLSSVGALEGRSAFLASPQKWRIVADFSMLAVFAGFYVTPLNVRLQLLAPPARRARFVAGSNVAAAVAMVASSAFAAGCVAIGLRAADVMALAGVSGAAVAVALWRTHSGRG